MSYLKYYDMYYNMKYILTITYQHGSDGRVYEITFKNGDVERFNIDNIIIVSENDIFNTR